MHCFIEGNAGSLYSVLPKKWKCMQTQSQDLMIGTVTIWRKIGPSTAMHAISQSNGKSIMLGNIL